MGKISHFSHFELVQKLYYLEVEKGTYSSCQQKMYEKLTKFDWIFFISIMNDIQNILLLLRYFRLRQTPVIGKPQVYGILVQLCISVGQSHFGNGISSFS